MKRKFVLGFAIVLGLTSVVIAAISVVTAHDGGNNLGGLAAPAAIGGVLLTLVYVRLRKADQEHK